MVVLRAIEDGIYTFDRNIPVRGHPYVIVHPYFDWYSVGEEGLWPAYRGYYKRIEDLIVGHKGPIITLEESARLRRTTQRYADLGRIRGSFFVETQEGSPEPSHIRWQDIAAFLQRFETRPVRIAGSYLTYRKSQSIGSCVAGAYEGLVDAGIYVEIDFSKTMA